ncbi:MAG: FAD-dependent oxidoreductase, partial [Thermodesulfobacteriota bacterium]|nr:FAD-dependent oxidoreductase [Thermodesulfobacteriota bacterium]
MKKKRLLIVGGVAGGASCAARARRLSEDIEIVIFERGPHVSYANCGLPYYVGETITEEKNLFVSSPGLFRVWFDIDVRANSDVLSIDRDKKRIEVQDLKTGNVYWESYDTLVLSPGAAPLRPKFEGVDTPGIFSLRTIQDSRDIINWIEEKKVKSVAVIGGGFIGLEMTENLKQLGAEVFIIEREKQLMPVIDSEMAAFVHEHLDTNGVVLHLGSPVAGFKQAMDGSISVMIASGKTLTVDMVLLTMGVRPEVELAKDCGLTIGELGGILVDDQQRTSDEDIFAVGDAVQTRDFITGRERLVPLAGPANRQGRTAADIIVGRNSELPRFRGVQASSICGVLGLTIASTGLTEKNLKGFADDTGPYLYEKIYLESGHHAGYYPGAQMLTLKLIFSRDDGRILGAQAVGKEGVDKRIDVIAMAIQMNGTVFDLEEAELCYAPQYGMAKDPVNVAGMIAANVLRGHFPIKH